MGMVPSCHLRGGSLRDTQPCDRRGPFSAWHSRSCFSALISGRGAPGWSQIMAPVKDWFRAFTTAQESGQRLKPKLGLLTQEAIRSWGGSHDQGAGEGEATGPDAEAGEGTRVEYQEGVGEEEGGDERDGDGAADGAGPRGIFRGETQLGGGGGRTVTTMPRGARRT